VHQDIIIMMIILKNKQIHWRSKVWG